jgi:hypothetical protein
MFRKECTQLEVHVKTERQFIGVLKLILWNALIEPVVHAEL